MKKTIKIKFIGMWPDFYENMNDYYLMKILNEFYDVKICDDADYIICSVFGQKYSYCNYPQIRIMWSGENYIPDFNLIDYSISSYPIKYLDRSFYLPVCYDKYNRLKSLQNKKPVNESFLQTKQKFANFIASHESEYKIRGVFFNKLSKYKKVDSAGTYLNNMSDGIVVNWRDNSKYEFQSKYKFSLCFESTNSNGFITEKITDAFYARTIPIYYGSSNVGEIFNKNAFINCMDYPDFESVINKIIEIDNNDNEYLKMINQPVFVKNDYVSVLEKELKEFILNIFNQPIKKAYRRSRVYCPQDFNNYLSEKVKEDIYKEKRYNSHFNRIKRKILNIIK